MCKKKKKKNLVTNLISFTKVNSKWLTDLNAKHKTIEKLEKELEKILVSLGWVVFLDLMPKAQSMEEKN